MGFVSQGKSSKMYRKDKEIFDDDTSSKTAVMSCRPRAADMLSQVSLLMSFQLLDDMVKKDKVKKSLHTSQA